MSVLKLSETQTKLTREQKEAVGLLSIGTFLEYFDLMLYVHMAVLLNELFFPKTDPFTTQILAAFTFCSTYVFRPFGALLFGWIGDSIGRRHTIIITTGLMAVCCGIMASLRTYDEIGITAAYVMMGCRIIQGMSSMGEVVGALLYLTEFIKRPARYIAVAMIPMFCGLGTCSALGIATIIISSGISWRIVFIFGVLVAVIGLVARTALRETPEFADAMRRLKNSNLNIQEEELQKYPGTNQVNLKTSTALFLMECMWPLCFFFVFVHCAQILKNNFGYTPIQIMQHNFIVSLSEPLKNVISIYFCRFFHPLKVLKYQLIISIMIYLMCPFVLENISCVFHLGILQFLVVICSADSKFASSVLYPHFPVLKRFKVTAVLYALSRALTYVVTSFGMIFLFHWIGNWGISLAMLAATMGVLYGLIHFWRLEKEYIYS